jgi:hypothetical protein
VRLRFIGVNQKCPLYEQNFPALLPSEMRGGVSNVLLNDEMLIIDNNVQMGD